MKLYYDYKRLYRYIFVLFLGILITIPIVFSYAQTAQELSDKISQKNTDISKLEEEIKQYQIELDGLGKQKNSLNVSIKQLDLTRKKLVADISLTQNKIDKTNLKIRELSLEINNKQERISNSIDAISLSIRQINEFEQNDVLATILSENNFTVVWNDIDNMVAVGNKIRQMIVELKQMKSDLEDTRKETTDAKNELVALKSKLADQKKIVDQNTAEKKKLLTQTKNSETNYQKLLKDRLAKKDAFEKELRDYESQLQYVLDPSKLPNGGVLSWPLDDIYITQLFGKTEAGKRLYANGSHNGVDFRASIGTSVKALADGVVAGTGNTDVQCPGVSFGRFILIKYNDGLASTFGHLSLIKVNIGDKVSRGQVVGYSGNTGYSTGPHLHVSIYAKDAVEVKSVPSKSCPGRILTQPIAPINAYLDPMYYLPRL
ncbi:MAG: peptidoglycan DD-metalloendopeptidase family protein [Candidatus Nomurabacteria bacterium]|nr:peptidoglycan DD-metalloendopeptidase family protein [Candidatus Nomurabacteria bacterium]